MKNLIKDLLRFHPIQLNLDEKNILYRGEVAIHFEYIKNGTAKLHTINRTVDMIVEGLFMDQLFYKILDMGLVTEIRCASNGAGRTPAMWDRIKSHRESESFKKRFIYITPAEQEAANEKYGTTILYEHSLCRVPRRENFFKRSLAIFKDTMDY